MSTSADSGGSAHDAVVLVDEIAEDDAIVAQMDALEHARSHVDACRAKVVKEQGHLDNALAMLTAAEAELAALEGDDGLG